MIHQPHCNRIISESNNTTLKDLVVWFVRGVNMDAFFQFYIKEGFLLPGALPWALGFHSQMKPQIHCLQQVRGSGASYSSPKGSLRDGDLQFYMCSFITILMTLLWNFEVQMQRHLLQGSLEISSWSAWKFVNLQLNNAPWLRFRYLQKFLKAELFQQFSGL